MKEVPFLTREQIEAAAGDLLSRYGARYGLIDKPPVPADEILDVFLKVSFGFDDLPKRLEVDFDVFGATWVDTREVLIDESLDPKRYPQMMGRFKFTVGHETGHWELHRVYLEADLDQGQLFESERAPSVICRTSQAKERIEWQADFFSSCLLMPKIMVQESWKHRCRSEWITADELRQMASKDSNNVSETEDAMIERFCKPMSKDFEVSPIAMRIRLETLGMIRRSEPPKLFELRSDF